MPIYEYTCDECSQPAEILLKDRPDKPHCPHCGAVELTRQFSTLAAHEGGASNPQQCPAGADETCWSGQRRFRWRSA